MKLVVIGTTMGTMLNFRGDLLRSLVARGHQVTVLCEAGSAAQLELLLATGVTFCRLSQLSQRGASIFGEYKFYGELVEILRDIRPDAVLTFFLKPVIWGGLASRRVGVINCIGMVEGLGANFSEVKLSWRSSLLRALTRCSIVVFLNISLPMYRRVIVLNEQNRKFLARSVLFPITRKLYLLDGIGVDLKQFKRSVPYSGSIRFTLISRLLIEKGVLDFAACASSLSHHGERVSFRIVGGVEPSQADVILPVLTRLEDDGVLEWVREVEDVRPYLDDTSVFVLPTLYGEGLPKSIMEAMAMSCPIITTDVAGARHSITDWESGVVVEAGSVGGLVAACKYFIDNPASVGEMGLASRSEAVDRYNVEEKVAQQIKLIEELF